MRAVVLHLVNGTTKVAAFTAAKVATQITEEKTGVVDLFDEAGKFIGGGLFAHVEAIIRDDAIDQYQPLTKPDQPE